jgi:hypothetical protein
MRMSRSRVPLPECLIIRIESREMIGMIILITNGSHLEQRVFPHSLCFALRQPSFMVPNGSKNAPIGMQAAHPVCNVPPRSLLQLLGSKA